MKTKTTHILSLSLAVLLLLILLAACQSTGADTPASGDNSAAADAPTLTDLPATDTLVLYIPEDMESKMQSQIVRYTELYGVEVETVIVEGGVEEYIERVVDDLAGGHGPDVLFLDELIYMDVAKAALNYNFLDLSEILAGDDEFSEDDYLAGVFDACRFGGRQYTIPTSFFLPAFLSTQSRLEELGFRWEHIGKTSDFLKEISRLTPYAEQSAGFAQMMSSKNYFGYFWESSGIRLLDYENNVILPDEEALGDFLYAYKTYFPYDDEKVGEIYILTSAGNGAESLIQGEFMFWLASFYITELTMNIDELLESPYGYVFSPLPSEAEEVIGSIRGQMAISANAVNKRNAYNFIKMMLSEEVQSNQRLSSFHMPIHKEAIKRIVYGTHQWDVSHEGKIYTFSGYRSTELSNEELDAIIETIISVDRFAQQNASNVSVMLFESMLPFFKDEKSYDDCLADLKNRLTLYLSE